MSRPLRIEEPGLWHHVMNRGAGARDVFLVKEDYESFLDLVAEAGLRWGLRVHAAALMSNHFHLLVQDTEGLLSRGMRHILGVYTQRFNLRHDADGALFRGRFRSRLVQTEEYLGELVRYIHLNPVRAQMVETAGAYRWSSHRHYLGPSPHVPSWLHTDEVLARFGGDTPEGRITLDSFVHEPVAAEVSALLHDSPWRPFLGTPDFVERWREALRDTGDEPTGEVPHRRSLLSVSGDEIVAAVTQHFHVTRGHLARSARGPGRGNLPRSLALVLLVDRTRLTHSEVASILRMSPSTVGSLAHKYRAAIREREDLRQHVAAILGRVGNPAKQ